MSMWPHHHHQRGPFGRGPLMRRRDLTQLYNDTKVNFESAFGNRNTTTSVFDDNDPDVVLLKKDFQEQQDRLLAWGMHWADKQASMSSKGKEAGYEVEIDEKVDQAGLGEVVAGIMENIKTTLSQSGRLQHPDRWKENRGPPGGFGGHWASWRNAAMKEKMGLGGPSPMPDKMQDWKQYELTTGRELYNKLKESIDLLYQLDSQQEDVVSSSKGMGAEAEQLKSQPTIPTMPTPSRPRHASLGEALSTKERAQAAHELQSHPLYIDFSQLEPMHDPNAADEPPSYEEARVSTQAIQAKSIYFFPAMQSHVLVDLAKAKSYPIIHGSMTADDLIKQTHDLSGLVSGKGLLTWDGHLKLLGFTLAHANSRFGLVYALPAPSDPTALQACQSLTTSIAATHENEASFPPLENKFRLAYNIALNVTSYLAHGHCHGHIKSSNIVFLRENDNPRLGKTLRCPYILQPIQRLVGEPSVGQSLRDTIYHNAGTEETGFGVVPAYDIFSVGLILLEIGLWRSLVAFWKPKYDPALFHARLLKYYVPKLASKCGTRYMNLVKMCFDAPERLQDKPSTTDAAQLLLDVVEELCRCCALDELGPPSELDIEVYESLIMSQRMEAPSPSKAASSQATPNPVRPVPVKKVSTASKTKQKAADALKKWPDLDIPQDHLETWNTMLMPRLSKMLKNALKDSMESCSVSLMMIGSTPEKAKTTICVQCRDTARVRETLCNRFKPKSGWGLVVCAGDVRRSGQLPRKTNKARGLARRSGAYDDMPHNNDDKTREQMYQPWPGNGASIGAWTNEHHLPPVSFGGTVIVDGQPYGMTVHHMLDDPEEVEAMNDMASPETPQRSTVPRASVRMPSFTEDPMQVVSQEDLQMSEALDELELFEPDEMVETSDEEGMSDAESDASTITPDYAVMDEDGAEFFIMDDSDEDDDEPGPPDLEDDEGHSSEESDAESEIGSVGDTPGLSADRLDDEDFCITQPAWDDVPENFFSDEPEYRDEEHLLSHSFGYVHASSGLKRMTRLNIKHEIDWALINIKESRLNLAVNPEAADLPSRKASRSSKMQRRRNTGQGTAFLEPALTSITPITALPKMKVSCVGRTSGRSTGRISQALSLLKLPGRESFSASFTVEGGMGVPGDSGAWVYNEEKQELCGHILAFSDSLGLAYIVPMEILFDDLKARLNAKEVRLPAQASSIAISPAASFSHAPHTTTTSAPIASFESEKENIPASSLGQKLQQLHINTVDANRERARTMSRPSSNASHREDTSPMSASSALARRSRAETIPKTQSPTAQLQLPTPPNTADTDRKCDRKDVYEFGGVERDCAPVTRAVPS